MVEGIGKAMRDVIIFLFVVCCITVPLGVWKLIEIIIWIVKHINISIN